MPRQTSNAHTIFMLVKMRVGAAVPGRFRQRHEHVEPFRDRCVVSVGILPCVESASRASNDGGAAQSSGQFGRAHKHDRRATFAQSFFLHSSPERTTVATCGTTVVTRDSAVTLWA